MAAVDAGVSRPSADVVALAVLGALAPFNLAVPEDGWNRLFLRPLLILTLVVASLIVMRHARRVLQLGWFSVAASSWLIAIWLSAAVSEAPWTGAAAGVRLSAFVLVTAAAASAVRSEGDVLWILRGIALGLVVACVIGLAVFFADRELLGTDHFFGRVTRLGPLPRLTRPWSHVSVAAMAIGMSVPALLVVRKRWHAALALAVVVPALVLTYSRGGVLGSIVAAVVVLALYRSRGDRLAVVGALVFAAIIVSGSSGWAGRLGGSERDAWYGVELSVPESIALSGEEVVNVVVTNESELTWRAAGSDRLQLSARWTGDGSDWVWAEQQWDLPIDLMPGESVGVRADLDGRVAAGVYTVVWDLVRDDEAYFEQFGGEATTTTVVVEASLLSAPEVAGKPFVSNQTPLGRRAIWDLAFDEFTAAPFFGVGPGQLATSVADGVADEKFFPGQHAHSTIVEPLATTGLLGAIPLFVLLGGAGVLALRTAWRERSAASVAVAAGLASAGVHGLVDWPIIFTSTAVPLGLLIGLAVRKTG